jgi:PAS domain S-box-containing protein
MKPKPFVEQNLPSNLLKELQKSEARFKAMFETSAVGIGIMGLDRKIIDANPAMCRMLEMSREELIGQTPQVATYPDDYPQSTNEFQQLISGEKEYYWSERRYVRKSGEAFWVHVTMSLVRDPNEKPLYLVGMVIDIDEQKRMMAELKVSEGRFRAIYDQAEMGIVLVNLEETQGQAVDDQQFDLLIESQRINPALRRMLGYSEEEINQIDIRSLIYPEDRGQHPEFSRQLFNGERDSYRIEKRYVRKDGSVFWGRLNYTLVRAADGRPHMAIGIIEDIDQEKHAQEHIRESEARFRAMFENAGIGIALVGLDRKALAVNDSLLKMSGYSREELLNSSGFDLSHPDDREIGLQEFRALVAGTLDSYQVERRYRNKNGVPYWVKQTVSAVRDDNGQLLYLVTMVEDIQEQKESQERLSESEARFRAMFDNASVGIALTTLDRRVVQINEAAARITGYGTEEFKQLRPVDLAIPEDREIGNEKFQELIAGQRADYSMEKRYQRKDGSIFWGRVTYSAVRDKGGQPQYLIGMIEDITEEKEANQKLADQEAEYRRTLEQRVEERTQALTEANLRLVAEIEQRQRAEEALAAKAIEEAIATERTRLARELHDAVTQTLFAASLMAEVLPDLWVLDENEARNSTEELRQLTRGALAEMRTLLLELRPAALTQSRFQDLLKQLVEAVVGRARLPVELTVEGDGTLPPDVQVALYRIAQESLNNIIKYARATQVNVKLTLSCCQVELEITDNGIGFDPATIKPTSMGMRIMHERAEIIGADFKVTSQPGQGTTVNAIWTEESEVTTPSA